jgi:hypothetical protein
MSAQHTHAASSSATQQPFPAAAAADEPQCSAHLTIDAYIGASVASIEFPLPLPLAASPGPCTPAQLAAAAVVSAALPEPLIEPCISVAAAAISCAIYRMQLAACASDVSSGAFLFSSDIIPSSSSSCPPLEFASCFRALCSHRESATTTAQVVRSYGTVIQEAQAQCVSQLAALHDTQQKEFSRSVLKNPLQRQEAIETMARAHSQKKKQVAAFWKTEIAQLKAAQRQEFRDFVVQQYCPDPQHPHCISVLYLWRE